MTTLEWIDPKFGNRVTWQSRDAFEVDVITRYLTECGIRFTRR